MADTAASAPARLLTIGTTTPWGPLSRTRLMWSCRLAGTRARAMQPGSAVAGDMCGAVSQSTRLCSMSTVIQEKPVRAMKRAAVMLPSDSQVPTEGWPAFNARLTVLGRMIFVSGGVGRRCREGRAIIHGARDGREHLFSQ